MSKCITEVRDEHKLRVASGLGKLLVWRLSAPKLITVCVIYDVGAKFGS